MATSVLLARNVRIAPLVQFVLNAWGVRHLIMVYYRCWGWMEASIVFKRDLIHTLNLISKTVFSGIGKSFSTS